MKKTIAMTAAAIILFASGCGSIEEEEKSAANNTADDVSSVSESSVSEAQSETDESRSTETLTSGEETFASKCSEDDSDEEDDLYEYVENIEGYKGEYINDSNCVILNPNNEIEADKEILYYSAELAIKQYNLIAKRDKQGFFEMLGYDRILRNEEFVKCWADGLSDRENYDPKAWIYGGDVAQYMDDLLGGELFRTIAKYDDEYLDEDVTPQYDYDDIYAECEKLIKKAAGMATWDNPVQINSCFNHLMYKYRSIDDSEVFSQPEKFVLTPSENTVYIIKYSPNGYCNRNEAGIYTNIDVIVINGDYACHFDDCAALLTSAENYVVPFSVAVTENRWKGLNAKEAGEKIFDEYYSDEARFAHEMYGEVWDMLCPDGYDDCPDEDPPEQPTWDEIIASGDFALAASENGLDISAESSEAYGDDLLCDLWLEDEGTAYMIHDPNDKSPFFIRYVSPDGKIGEYHAEDNHWF